MPRLLAFLVGMIFALSAPAFGQGNSVTVTIYNQNRALITEVREMNLPRGVHPIEFPEVAETIDPTSLQVRSLTSPDQFKILDQNYEYDLINSASLLNRYIGKPLRIIVPNPEGPPDAKMIVEATLLSNNDRPIFQIIGREGSAAEAGGDIYIGPTDGILLAQMPPGLRPQPTLVWLVDNQGEKKQRIEASYLAEKMNWKADYVLKLDRESTKGALSGWVTLDNQCGKAFTEAKLKLVAGDVHQVRHEDELQPLARKMLPAAPAAGMQEESLFEYHLYSLDRPVDIGNRQTKQVALLQSPQLALEKHLIGQWTATDSAGMEGSVQKQKLSVVLKFANSAANGLGIPLPKGIVRAYQESADGTVIFVGEDRIEHTGKDATVELKTGEAFDVIVERRLTGYNKVSTNAARYAWELRIKNSKESPQPVELEEILPGEWKMLSSNTPFEKLDAHRIRFSLDASPTSSGQDALVTYEAEVRW